MTSKLIDAAALADGGAPASVAPDTSAKAPPPSAKAPSTSAHPGAYAAEPDRIEWDRDEPANLVRQEEVKLVQRLFLSSTTSVRRVVLFAGVDRENRSIAVCLQAGRTLARLTPHSVCVVDANLRAPALHRLLGTDDRFGLAAAIAQSSLASTYAVRSTPENLWLLPSGGSSSGPDLLLATDRVRPRVEELSGLFDHVLVNAPPIDVYAESLALCQFVEGVVLVLQANATRREIVRHVKTRLEELEVPLLGIVLNDRTFPIPDAVYRLL